MRPPTGHHSGNGQWSHRRTGRTGCSLASGEQASELLDAIRDVS